MNNSSTKVHFKLIQDEDGYPPVAVESLWAHPGQNINEFVIDSVPFFACDATLGDIVLVRKVEEQCWFDELIHCSKNSLVRVVLFNLLCVERIRNELEILGCSTEYFENFNILAVNISEHASLGRVQEYLKNEFAEGNIDYEEPILRHE